MNRNRKELKKKIINKGRNNVGKNRKKEGRNPDR